MFQKCFPQQLMSACVKWAKEHIDQFNILLKRQLSSVGLDFTELVGNGIGGQDDEEAHAPVGLGVSA